MPRIFPALVGIAALFPASPAFADLSTLFWEKSAQMIQRAVAKRAPALERNTAFEPTIFRLTEPQFLAPTADAPTQSVAQSQGKETTKEKSSHFTIGPVSGRVRSKNLQTDFLWGNVATKAEFGYRGQFNLNIAESSVGKFKLSFAKENGGNALRFEFRREF